MTITGNGYTLLMTHILSIKESLILIRGIIANIFGASVFYDDEIHTITINLCNNAVLSALIVGNGNTVPADDWMHIDPRLHIVIVDAIYINSALEDKCREWLKSYFIYKVYIGYGYSAEM